MAGAILLDSKSSRLPSKNVRLSIFALGIFLLGNLVWLALQQKISLGSGSFSAHISQGFVGIACLIGACWHRTLCLTTEGVFRESFLLGAGQNRRRSELLPWGKIEHVSLAFRKNEMMVLFDRGELTGIRVLFDKGQEEALRGILKQYLPGIRVDVL